MREFTLEHTYIRNFMNTINAQYSIAICSQLVISSKGGHLRLLVLDGRELSETLTNHYPSSKLSQERHLHPFPTSCTQTKYNHSHWLELQDKSSLPLFDYQITHGRTAVTMEMNCHLLHYGESAPTVNYNIIIQPSQFSFWMLSAGVDTTCRECHVSISLVHW